MNTMLALPPMDKISGNVVAVALSKSLQTHLQQALPSTLKLDVLAGPQRLSQLAEQGILQCDVVVLDASIENWLNISQQVHSFDKTIPILILATEKKCAALSRSIMFAPLLGSAVTPWSLANTSALPEALINAVERHRQRRHYLDTISSVQPKLGNLTLSQPEVGHYLGRLLNQAPIGVISLDSDGCILDVNQKAVNLLGTTERHAMGIALLEYFKVDQQHVFSRMLTRCTVSQVFGSKPEVFERVSTGSKICHLEVTASPISYRANRRGYMVILQDVSNRERAERRRKKSEDHMRKLSSALEQAADSVMITDENRTIEYVNPAFEKLTGYSREEAVGKKTNFLRSGVLDISFYGKMWDFISSGNTYRGVLINRKKDGNEYYEKKTITPLRNQSGAITHYVSTGHDITNQRNAEKAAKLHQDELAHVARLGTLGEMTSGLAHELNQPLCAITTYSQTCLRVLASNDLDTGKLRYGLEQVVKQAQHASAVFERLRNFSRKDALPKRKVNLVDLVNEVINLSAMELHENGITFVVENADSYLYTVADPIQIEQVLLNLLRNSIDSVASLPKERREITLSLERNQNHEIKASLSDTGCGCSEEDVERLFEPFYTTKPNGLGIGLGISQSIIEAHHGRLVLESNSTTGATFSFTLPAVDSDRPIAS